MHYEFEKKPPDYSRSAELYRFACEEGSLDGCVGLARLYEAGNGVVRDLAKAMKLLRRACKLGDSFSCNRPGVRQ
ncbi:MAG: tetratricopeptide repeat protein [Gammaproteobacteria bacterium]